MLDEGDLRVLLTITAYLTAIAAVCLVIADRPWPTLFFVGASVVSMVLESVIG